MRYDPALDGIRAMAAFVVLLFHAKVPGMSAGRIGVDIFFVLSGFLITRLLVAEHQSAGRIAFGSFYVRRLKRLWPALLFMLAGYLAIAPFAFSRIDMDTHWRDAAIAGLYLADYSRTFGIHSEVLDHMWSLSIEEHFYLIWPVILLVLLKLPRLTAMWVVFALFAAVTFWRAHLYPEIGWLTYHRLDTHSSGILLGCLAGLSNIKLRQEWGWLGIIGLLVTIASYQGSAWLVTYGFTMAELSSVLIVLSPPAWLSHPSLAWLGKMSYGFYLWHYLVIRVLRENTETGWIVHLTVGTVVGLAMAALSYYTVERAFRSGRRGLVGMPAREISG